MSTDAENVERLIVAETAAAELIKGFEIIWGFYIPDGTILQ